MDWAAERVQTVDREPSEVPVRQGKYLGGVPSIRRVTAAVAQRVRARARPVRPYCLRVVRGHRRPGTLSVGSAVERVPFTGLPSARHGHCGRLYLAQIDHVTGSGPDEPHRLARAGRLTAPALAALPLPKICHCPPPASSVHGSRGNFPICIASRSGFSRIFRTSVRFSDW